MAIAALALWQGQDTFTAGDVHWLLILAGIAAFSLLIQLLISLGIWIGVLVGVLKAKKALSSEIADLKAKVMPLVDRAGPVVDQVKTTVAQVNGFIEEMKPKIADITDKVTVITGHAEDVSTLVKDKLHEFSPTISAANQTLQEANQTARDANAKAQSQIGRVNGMVSGVLDATEQAGKKIQRGITMPVREVSGLLSGIKAGFMTLLNGKPKAVPPTYRAPIGIYEGSGDGTREPGLHSD